MILEIINLLTENSLDTTMDINQKYQNLKIINQQKAKSNENTLFSLKKMMLKQNNNIILPLNYNIYN